MVAPVPRPVAWAGRTTLSGSKTDNGILVPRPVAWAGRTTLTGSKTETKTGWVFRPEGPILLAKVEGLGILAVFLLGVMADLLCQLLQELFHRGFVGHFRGVARDKELIR